MLLGFCDGWVLGTLLGTDNFFCGSETTLLGLCALLGFCDGWELGTLLGAGDFVGGSEATLLGFCEGFDDGVLDGWDNKLLGEEEGGTNSVGTKVGP